MMQKDLKITRDMLPWMRDPECSHPEFTTMDGKMYICRDCGLGTYNPPVVIDAEFYVIEET